MSCVTIVLLWFFGIFGLGSFFVGTSSSIPMPEVADTSPAAEAACQTLADDDAPIITTDSGLQYQVLVECEGASPSATDSVTVHYVGTLEDGTEFDSSYSRGQPATFPLDGVIAGWTEGLQLMTVGSRYRFIIPPELAYGEAGAGAAIPPNATLIFEVELLGIE